MDATPMLNGHTRILPPSHPTSIEATSMEVDSPRTPLARPPLLEPEGIPPPRRKLILESVDLLGVVAAEPISQLAIRDLKGPGGVYTPNLAHALKLKGIIHKPPGQYQSDYQLLAGAPIRDARLASLIKVIAFVPAFVWSSLELVLLPIPMTTNGNRVFSDLQKLTTSYELKFKAYTVWDSTQFRHRIFRVGLDEGEVAVIDGIPWPTKEEILDVLQESAFDDVAALAKVNDNVRTILTATEVV